MKVIYTLRLKPPIDVNAEAATAKYIVDHHAADLAGFELGNEPDLFDKHLDEYAAQWLALHDAVLNAAGPVTICGPSTAGGSWPAKMATDPRFAGKVQLVTFHAYPGGNGEAIKTDPAAARDKLLSTQIESRYEHQYQTLVPDLRAAKLPYRIAETNSLYNAGGEEVSDTFASALWALEYLNWWADHGAAGLNFHTGDQTAAGAKMRKSWYALFWKQGDGFDAHPIAYACKAFSLAGAGRRIPLKLTGVPDTFRAHAALRDDGSVAVTLINLAHGDGDGGGVCCAIQFASMSKIEAFYLSVPKGDVAAKAGVLLGGNSIDTGGSIKPNGTWDGKPSVLPSDREGEGSITVPPASAAVVILRR